MKDRSFQEMVKDLDPIMSMYERKFRDGIHEGTLAFLIASMLTMTRMNDKECVSVLNLAIRMLRDFRERGLA